MLSIFTLACFATAFTGMMLPMGTAMVMEKSKSIGASTPATRRRTIVATVVIEVILIALMFLFSSGMESHLNLG